MGCRKITYHNEDKPLESFRKNLKVAYTTSGVNTKKGLNSSTFGSLLPGRNASSGDYRYGFNGMEKDDEVKNITGSSYTTEFRQYDPRLGRWLSRDPLAAQFPWQSPYVAFDNNPILKNDPRGDAASKPDSDRAIRRKTRKFQRVENRMAKQTGLQGDELRAAVYDRYADKNFASIKAGVLANGDMGIIPTGDQLDFQNGVTTTQQRTITNTQTIAAGQIGVDIGTSTIDNRRTAQLNIPINPGETVNVNITSAVSNPSADQISVVQNGNVLATGNVTNTGDAVNAANITAAGGNQITVSLVMGTANFRNDENNPTGNTSGDGWTSSRANVTITRTSTVSVLKQPRVYWFGGSFGKLWRSGVLSR